MLPLHLLSATGGVFSMLFSIYTYIYIHTSPVSFLYFTEYCHLQCVKGGTLQLINDTCRCQCPPTRTGDLCGEYSVRCELLAVY